MPRCLLSQQFCSLLKKQQPLKTIQYTDEDLPCLLLEYRKSGKGTWYFRYTDPVKKMRYCRIGAMHQISAVQARALAYSLSSAVAVGQDPKMEVMLPQHIPTLHFFIEKRYMPHIKKQKRSWRVDEAIAKAHIIPLLGEYLLSKIQVNHIQLWQQQMQAQGISPSTFNRRLAVLKTIFSYAIQWKFLPEGHSPCIASSPLKIISLRERFLTQAEAHRVLQIIDTMPYNQNALALKLLLFTGARKSEIMNARWEYVHLAQRRLTVPLSKSGKARHISLSDTAVAIIEQLPRYEHCPWLFPAADKQQPFKGLFYIWKKIRNLAGLEDVRIHDLRHSFASFLVNDGFSLYTVQTLLGHSDPKVTMRYAHLAQPSLVAAVNTLDKHVV